MESNDLETNFILNLQNVKLDLSKLKDLVEITRENKYYNDVIWPNNKPDLINDLEMAKLIQNIELNIIKNNDEFTRFPSDYIHATMSCDVYRNFDLEKENKVKFGADYWKIIEIFEYPMNDNIKNLKKGSVYFGVLYLNKFKKQLVLAHRGFNINLKSLFSENGEIKKDIKTVLVKSALPQLLKCHEFTKKAINIAKKNKYFLSFTGYSNGAWLAEHSFNFSQKETLETRAVLFESPGLGFSNVDHKKSSNIINYLFAPNILNTSNVHSGRVFRLFLSNTDNKNSKFLSKLNELPSKFNQYIINSKFVLQGLSSIYNKNRDLNVILDECFDKITGQPKYCEEVIEWPLLEFDYLEKNLLNLENLKNDLFDESSTFQDDNSHLIEILLDSISKSRLPAVHVILNLVNEMNKSNFDLTIFNKNEFNTQLFIHNNIKKNDDLPNNRFKYLYPNQLSNNHHSMVENIIDKKLSVKFNSSYSTIVHFKDLCLSNLKENLLHLAKLNLKNDQPTKIMFHSLINLKSNLNLIEVENNLELIHSIKENQTIEMLNERLNHFISLYPTILSDLNEARHIFKIQVKPVTKLVDFLPPKDKHFIVKLNYEELDAQIILNNTQFLLIHGPSGIGKTASACEYGHHLRETRQFIVRLFQMDSFDRIETNYILYLSNLFELDKKISNKNNYQHEFVLDVLNQKLKETDWNVLFIFDNVDFENEESVKLINLILTSLPENIHVLATSKSSYSSHFKHHFTVNLFDRFQARTLLTSYLKTMEKDIETILNSFQTNEFKPIYIRLIITCFRILGEGTVSYLISLIESKSFHKSIFNKIFSTLKKDESMNELMIRLSLIESNDICLKFLNNLITNLDNEKLGKLIDKLKNCYLIKENIQDKDKISVFHEEIYLNLIEFIQKTTKKDNLLQTYQNDMKIFMNMFKKGDLKQSDFNHIQKYVDQLVNLNIMDDNLVELYQMMGDYLAQNRKYSKSNEYYNKMTELINKNGDNNIEKIIFKIALNHRQKCEYSKSNEYFNKSLELYQKSNSNKADIASILNNIGLNYIDMNLADNAIDSFQNSLEIYRQIESKNSFIIADILNNIGKAYLILNDHEKSLEYFTQSLDLIKNLEENETNSATIAIILYNIGGCYFSLRKFRLAIENYDNSLNEFNREQNQNEINYSKIASIYNNMGVCHLFMKEFHKSIDFFTQSIKIHENHLEMKEDESSMASILTNLGTSYSGLNEYEKAIEFYQQSLQIKYKLYSNEFHGSIASTLSYIGSAYKNWGNFKKSIEFYNKSLNIYKNIYSVDKNHPTIDDLIKKIEEVKILAKNF